MDTALLHVLNGFATRHDGFEDAVTVYEGLAQVLFVALLGGLLLAGGRRLRRAAVAGGVAAAVALACAQVISRLVDRPRPFVADPSAVHLFAAHAADAGFPSDHATGAFAIAVALLLRDRRWGAGALILAAALAVGRVAIGVHYPTDVIAGAVLGTAVALALHVPGARGRNDRLADRIGALWSSAAGDTRVRTGDSQPPLARAEHDVQAPPTPKGSTMNAPPLPARLAP
jgi:undecaprenyl-diphosphatase